MQNKIPSSIKKATLLLATALPLSVHALGLGDIEVYSALNQPLDAEIDVTSAKPGEVDSLIARLASEQAFIKAGVERPFLLTKLKFTPIQKPDGTAIIKIQSGKPMREPFLNFLVDVEWPRGRLVREYTILLDPPSFATRKPVTTAAPVAQAAAPSVQGSAPIQRDTGVYGFDEPAPSAAAIIDEPLPEPEIFETPGVETVAIEEEPIFEPLPEPEVLAEPEPVFEAEPEAIFEPETDTLVSEALAFDDPLPEPQIETVDITDSPDPLESSSDSPFTSLLSDIESEESAAASQPIFEENIFAPDAEELPFESALEASEPAFEQSLPVDGELPDIQIDLDESIPYNAESILAQDNDYVDPEIEALLRADPIPLYREATPAVVEIESEPFFEPEPVVEAPSGDYVVQKGDIMLEIAEQYRPSDVDINQAMLAIMRYNPDAFIKENVNLVKTGAVLRIPDRNEMLNLTNRAAQTEVSAQHALWREYKAQLAGAQSVQTPTGPVSQESAPSQAAVEGDTRLALVAPGKDDEATDFAAGNQEGDGELRRLQRDLALAKEKLEANRLQKEELQSRINELDAIVTQSDSIINLRNQQLAQLQANAEEANAGAEEVAEAVEETFSEEGAVEQSEADIADELANDIAGESAVVEEATAEAEESTPSPVVVTSSEPETQRPSGIGGILYDMLPLSMRSTFGPMLDGPLAWVILLLPILIIAGIVFAMKRKKEEDVELRPIQFESSSSMGDADEDAASLGDDDLNMTITPSKPSIVDKIKGLFSKKESEPEIVFEDDPVSMTGDGFDTPADDSEVDATMALDATMAMDSALGEDDAMEDFDATMISETVAQDSSTDDDTSDDTTAEADVYIAYGLFDQAEELLKQAIADNPDNRGYKGKLLESHYNAGNKDEFIDLAQQLHDEVGGEDSAVWNKTVALGKEIAPENALFSGAGGDLKASDFAPAKPAEADFDLGDGSDMSADIDLGADEIDLGMDDLSEDAVDLGDEDVAEISQVAEVEEDEFSLDDIASELDDSLGGESSAEEAAGDLEFDVSDFMEETEEDSSDDLGADLDLDFDDAPAEAPAEEMDVSLDLDDSSDDLDLGADLDLDMGDADSAGDLDLDMGDDSGSDDGLDLDMDADLGLDLDDAPAEEASADDLDLDAGMDLDLDASDDLGLDLDDAPAEEEPASDMDAGLDFDMDDGLNLDNIDDAIDDAGDMDLDLDAGMDLDMDAGMDLDDDMGDATQMIDDSSLESMMGEVESEASTFDIGDAPDSLDEVGTKLDLAKAYIDMGDSEGARASLEEVLEEGNDAQRSEAQQLLDQM